MRECESINSEGRFMMQPSDYEAKIVLVRLCIDVCRASSCICQDHTRMIIRERKNKGDMK